jgi:hypothetical protein
MKIDTNGFELGDVVRDKISGGSGVIVGMTIWTTGCVRAIVQPPVSDDFAKTGKFPDTFSVDVAMLVTTGEANRLAAKVDRSIGGPMPTPSR